MLPVPTTAAALALSASQAIDMRLTGRGPSETPLLVVERLTGRRPTGAAGTLASHAVQSSLALTAVLAARAIGGSRRRRALVAWTAGFNGAWLGDLALGAIDPPWAWTQADLARDAIHKAVMGLAASR